MSETNDIQLMEMFMLENEGSGKRKSNMPFRIGLGNKLCEITKIKITDAL